MKLKELVYYLGFRPQPREYGFDIDHVDLPLDGRVELARWHHPKETRKNITQAHIDALRTFVREGDGAVDVGAHTGDTSIPIALAAGATGVVFASEPNPYVFKVLRANASLNRQHTNIHPLPFAATPNDGQFDFQYSDPGFCNGGLHDRRESLTHAHCFPLQVEGRNLWEYLRREHPDDIKRIRYIKIDTEGFDRAVVASLNPLLRASQPYLRSEIFKLMAQTDREGYYDELRQLGYRVHRLGSEEDYVGQELTRSDMMRWRHFDIFAIPASAQ